VRLAQSWRQAHRLGAQLRGAGTGGVSRLAQRYLALYAGVLTAVFAATLLAGYAGKGGKARFEELTVERLNLVEPDGTLRLVMSDRAHFPGAIIRGREYRHPRPDAGLLFFNDEGTEDGGLIFSGHRDSSGRIVDSGGSLTFDQYEQDQLVQLLGQHDSEGHIAGLIVSDRPERPIQQDLAELPQIAALPQDQQQALMAQRRSSTYYGASRISVIRGTDGVATVSLRDAAGRERLVLGVAADGSASVKFLDAQGRVQRELTP
jgi:hypothetical protein